MHCRLTVICIYRVFSPNGEDMPLVNPPNKRRKINRLIPTLRQSVCRDDNCLRDELDLSSFGFDQEGISVADSQEGIEGQPSIEFVDDDDFMPAISIPPLTALFPVGIWIGLHGVSRLSSACWTLIYTNMHFMVSRLRL